MSDIMILCERHLIKSTHPFYDECDKLTFLAKEVCTTQHSITNPKIEAAHEKRTKTRCA